MGTLRSGERWLDSGEVELHDFTRVIGVRDRSVINAVKSLSLKILLNHADTVRVSADQVEVLDRLVVNWEEAHGRAVLWGHVSDGSSISEGEARAAWSKEFDELTNDTAFTKQVGAGENEICGCSVSWQVASELEANDLGEHHGNLLSEHDGLSLDATDTPANDTETIDHSGVRVSAHNGVWVEDTVLLEDDASEVLKVDLMDDTIAWWDNAEVGEGGLAPLEESESLLVPVELDLLVLVLGVGLASDIDLDGVINNEIGLAERVDLVGVTTELLHSSTHGGEINDGWDTSEVLKEDASWLEGNLEVLLRGNLPVQDSLNISSCVQVRLSG